MKISVQWCNIIINKQTSWDVQYNEKSDIRFVFGKSKYKVVFYHFLSTAVPIIDKLYIFALESDLI